MASLARMFISSTDVPPRLFTSSTTWSPAMSGRNYRKLRTIRRRRQLGWFQEWNRDKIWQHSEIVGSQASQINDVPKQIHEHRVYTCRNIISRSNIWFPSLNSLVCPGRGQNRHPEFGSLAKKYESHSVVQGFSNFFQLASLKLNPSPPRVPNYQP